MLTIELSAQGRGVGLCQVQGQALWDSFALLSGVAPEALAGSEFIVDRQGWVRARAQAGKGDWSAEDLLCRAGQERTSSPMQQEDPKADGLDELIRRMESQPVRLRKGGVPH